MPLVVADRIVGLVGLAVPTHLITTDTAELLRPLVGVVAATVESITNATQHTVQMLSLSGVPFRADVTVGTFALAEDRRAAVLTFRDIEAELLAQATALRAADLLASTPDLVVWTDAAGAIDFINTGGRALVGLADTEGMTIEDLFPRWGVERFNRDIAPVLREHGCWVGATDYVVKPFSPRELLSRVRGSLVRAGVR